jgi:membrane protease YdiL (CAAX protease family)
MKKRTILIRFLIIIFSIISFLIGLITLEPFFEQGFLQSNAIFALMVSPLPSLALLIVIVYLLLNKKDDYYLSKNKRVRHVLHYLLPIMGIIPLYGGLSFIIIQLQPLMGGSIYFKSNLFIMALLSAFIALSLFYIGKVQYYRKEKIKL